MKKIIIMFFALLICTVTSAQVSLQSAKHLWTQYDFMHAQKARVYFRLKTEKQLDFQFFSQPKREYVRLLSTLTLKSADVSGEQLVYGHATEYMEKIVDGLFQTVIEFKKNEAMEHVCLCPRNVTASTIFQRLISPAFEKM